MSHAGESAPRLIDGIVTAGATARHIARILGVTESVVSRWRSGERKPSDLHLMQLRKLHHLVYAHITPHRLERAAS